MEEPVGTDVQEQPELVGLPARARGLVRAREAFHVLDQVLGIATCAEHLLVERLAPTFEAGDDEADVGSKSGRLDSGDELARAAPLARPIGKLVEAAHRRHPSRSAQVALFTPGRREIGRAHV